MVTAKEFSAWNSPGSSQLERNCNLLANVGFLGQSVSDLHGFNPGPQDAVNGFFRDISYPTSNAYLKDSKSHGLEVITDNKPIDTPQKRFLIFDQSGNQTRFFLSNPSFSPPENPRIASKGPHVKMSARVDERFLIKKPVVEEKWDENNLSDEEGEMLEDSEEIDALLYSDSDYDDEYDDDDDDDDEVTSTGHNTTQFGTEESKLPKRQRLLDGKYNVQSSLVSGESPVKNGVISCNYEDDVDEYSSCYDSSKREKKVKTRQALKILENIIPGLNSKDPLSIIDKAIAYLKSMKTEAESLGLGYPECNPLSDS